MYNLLISNLMVRNETARLWKVKRCHCLNFAKHSSESRRRGAAREYCHLYITVSFPAHKHSANERTRTEVSGNTNESLETAYCTALGGRPAGISPTWWVRDVLIVTPAQCQHNTPLRSIRLVSTRPLWYKKQIRCWQHQRGRHRVMRA
jgi:hypothetical protein